LERKEKQKDESAKHQRELEKTRVSLENKKNEPLSPSEKLTYAKAAWEDKGIPDLETRVQKGQDAIDKMGVPDTEEKQTALNNMVAEQNRLMAELEQKRKSNPDFVAYADSFQQGLLPKQAQAGDTTQTPPAMPAPTDQPIPPTGQADPQEAARALAEQERLKQEIEELKRLYLSAMEKQQ
jgi:hypothetical protein